MSAAPTRADVEDLRGRADVWLKILPPGGRLRDTIAELVEKLEDCIDAIDTMAGRDGG